MGGGGGGTSLPLIKINMIVNVLKDITPSNLVSFLRLNDNFQVTENSY